MDGRRSIPAVERLLSVHNHCVIDLGAGHSVYEDDEDADSGNDDLRLYATLLLPFGETNPNVQPLIQQGKKCRPYWPILISWEQT